MGKFFVGPWGSFYTDFLTLPPLYRKTRKLDRQAAPSRMATEVSLTTITDDTLTETENSVSNLNGVKNQGYCKRLKVKEKVATESVVILGSYFIATYGTFIILQYFMPVGFYTVTSVTKYNTLLLVQLLLPLNSSLNPLVHYWRNAKIRRRVNRLLQSICHQIFKSSPTPAPSGVIGRK